MIKRDELIKIGVFNKPHGVQGELAFTFTDDIFDRSECPYVVCEIDGIFVPFFIEEYRFRGETTALMKLEDIDTEDDARAFTNLEVYFPKSYIESDEDGELSAPGDFFLHYAVYDTDEGYLGNIVDVDMSTANVLFVVERENGEELLIPATDDLVVSVDEKAKKIEMNIPEGLLDL
mgnify:FL=1